MRSGLLLAALLVAARTAPATVFVPLDDPELVGRSAAIVQGRVAGVGSRREGSRIVTDTAIAATRVFKGGIATPTVVVTTPGGRVGEDEAVVFGIPRFAPGDAVLLFLQEARGGEVRTTGLAHGAFRVERRADGAEHAVRTEPFARVLDLGDLAALVQSLGDPGAVVGGAAPAPYTTADAVAGSRFTFLGGAPSRWFEPDTGTPVRLRVANADPKFGAGTSNAVIDAALAAWTEVASATITLERGTTTSPAPSVASGVCDGVNTIQFGDPEDEFPDLQQCTGVLAIGGFCVRSGSRVVNGIQFRRIAEGDLTVAKGIGECVQRRGLEEIVTHEVGHVIGLGHSSENASEPDPALSDATMYFLVHFDGRGASLRADDIAGVTAAYPVQVDPNDLDGDGVPNADDHCPTTPAATPVDGKGCACGEAGHAACDDGLGCTGDFCEPTTGRCDAAPVDCTNGDTCLVGSCEEAAGCSTAPVGGNAAVTCAYGRLFPPSACGGARVSAAVRRGYRAAGRLATRGLERGKTSAFERAARRLDRARTRVARDAARNRRPLDAACAAALDALLADARARLPVSD